MSDIKLSLFLDPLKTALKDLNKGLQNALNAEIKDIAMSAYRELKLSAEIGISNPAMLRLYLSNLKFQKLGSNSYLISLSGDMAVKLEDGSGPFSLKNILLKSKSMVSAGPNTGKPWVQTSKEGYKYAHVPISHKLKGINKSNLADAIKGLKAKGRNGITQNITKVFKDVNTGLPLTGKVASSGSNVENPNLSNVTKYQEVTNAGKIKSLYITYRTVSNNPKSNSEWNHPGFEGIKAFPEVEKWIEEQFRNLVLSKELS